MDGAETPCADAMRPNRLARVEQEALRGRVRRADVAEGVRGRRSSVHLPGDLPRGDGKGRDPRAHRSDRARYGGPDDHRSRHRGAESRSTSPRSSRARMSGVRDSRSPAAAPTSPRSGPRRSETATSSSSAGQKVWSSFAHIADWCILMTRTDTDAPKHKGITYIWSTCTRPVSRCDPCARSPATRSSTRSSSATSGSPLPMSSARSTAVGESA